MSNNKRINLTNIIVAIIISFGILGYGTVTYLSKEKDRKITLQEKEISAQKDCGERGQKIYDRESNNGKDTHYLLPEFHYNSETKKCYYFGGYLTKDGLSEWVKNVDTKEEVLTYTNFYENGKLTDWGMSRTEFEKKKTVLLMEIN